MIGPHVVVAENLNEIAKRFVFGHFESTPGVTAQRAERKDDQSLQRVVRRRFRLGEKSAEFRSTRHLRNGLRPQRQTSRHGHLNFRFGTREKFEETIESVVGGGQLFRQLVVLTRAHRLDDAQSADGDDRRSRTQALDDVFDSVAIEELSTRRSVREEDAESAKTAVLQVDVPTSNQHVQKLTDYIFFGVIGPILGIFR